MKKTKLHIHTANFVFYFFILFSSTVFSQKVGVNIVTPLDIFHVDAKGNNNGNINPTTAQQSDDFIVTSDGNVGIGTITPNNKLHIISDKDPLIIEGLESGNINTNNFLVIDKNNIIKKAESFEDLSLPIPFPAIFILEQDQKDFLQNASGGFSQIVPFTLDRNHIGGMSFDEDTSTITLPKGTYQFSFTYQATHIQTTQAIQTCQTSSYFIEFPSDTKQTERITNTSSYLGGPTTASSHSGTLNYTVTLPGTTTWQIKLGRGLVGNCYFKGMTLQKDTTQMIIYKLG